MTAALALRAGCDDAGCDAGGLMVRAAEASFDVSFGAKPTALATRSNTLGSLRADEVMVRGAGVAGVEVDAVWIEVDCIESLPNTGADVFAGTGPDTATCGSCALRGGFTCAGMVPGAGL